MKNILPIFDNSSLYRFNALSKKFTWFQTGGTIDALFKPATIDQLKHFLTNYSDKQSIKVIGNCSNIIIRDGGIRGVVVRLGANFNYIKTIDDVTIEVGGSTHDYNISKFACENGIGGMEFLSGIPGSLGGNIRMNAGCYGFDISNILMEYEAIDLNGVIYKFNKDDIDFKYRHNPQANNFIFTKAILRGYKDSKENIINKMEEIKQKRVASQPVKSNTGGSTFINPPEHKAWQLIDNCGLRGAKIGGAQVSTQHCNFLLNLGTATSIEIEALGEMIRASVKERYNINLEWEIERYGDFSILG